MRNPPFKPLKPLKPAHLTSTNHRITRELVLLHLHHTDASHDYRAQCESLKLEAPAGAQTTESKSADWSVSGAAGDTLEHVQKWLHHLAGEEESRMDWTSEFPKQASGIRPNGLSTPVVDTTMSDRILRGLGPRDVELEDLLAPFRGYDPKKDSRDLASNYGSYSELKDMLLSWNAAVVRKKHGHGGQPDGVCELIEALGERKRALVGMVDGQEASERLDRRVVQAIHALHPEIEDFVRKDPYSLLAVMIANRLVVNPDLQATEPGLLDAMMANLLIESLYHVNKASPTKQLSITAEIESARQRGDVAEMKRSRRKRFDEQAFINAGIVLLDDLRRARRNLSRTKLEELQTLAIAQTSQKWYLGEARFLPLTVLLGRCKFTDSQLGRIVRERMEALEALQESTESKVKSMKELGNRCHLRSRRLSAMDRPEKERDQVVKKRMDHPETCSMMMAVVNEVRDMQQSTTAVSREMDQMDEGLQDLCEAAKSQLQTYEDAHSRVDGEDVDG